MRKVATDSKEDCQSKVNQNKGQSNIFEIPEESGPNCVNEKDKFDTCNSSVIVTNEEDNLDNYLDTNDLKWKNLFKKKYKLVNFEFPQTLLKQHSVNRLRWDFFIIFLAVYQAVTIPINISFDPDYFNGP